MSRTLARNETQTQPKYQGTIFHLLSPEVVTLILRQVLLGKKGIRDFESLLLAYPHLHDLVLFVTDSTDKNWTLSQYPFHKLFKEGQTTDAIYPVSLEAINTKTVASICSPTRALKLFVFQEFDESLKCDRLNTDRTCEYGQSIAPGSFIVSCAHDKRLFGHQALVTIAEKCGAVLIHHSIKLSENSKLHKNKPTLVDGSSPYFLFANSQWVENSRLSKSIRATARRLYDKKSIDNERNNVIEIGNCHNLRYGTLETSHAKHFRIKIARGCRQLHGKNECIAPVVKIEGPVKLEELAIDYESERLPEIYVKGISYTRSNISDKSQRNTLKLRNKRGASTTGDEPDRQTSCQHQCRERAWSLDYRVTYFVLTRSFAAFEYESVPDCVLRATNFSPDVERIHISNLQFAESSHYDPSTGKPIPHYIQGSNRLSLSISAVVTKETMHLLPRFWLHNPVDIITLEQLEGSDQFWDLEWLFSGRTIEATSVVFRHRCGIESEFLRIEKESVWRFINRDTLASILLKGYSPEFLWPGDRPALIKEESQFPRLLILEIDITDMPVDDTDTFGRDLRLAEYFPNLTYLRLTGRLSRSCKWPRGVSLDLHTPPSLRMLEVRPAIPLKNIWNNDQSLQIDNAKCRRVPFLTNRWSLEKTSEKPEGEASWLWHHKLEVEWPARDWSHEPDVYY